ncbi:MAG: AAA family ATPase [Promethearchaeota archaeon]
MTYIKEIIFHGFKSFGDQSVKIELGKGYTCVVGPNGSGKSNIIDGLCFALGRLSKKTMRAQNLRDLIFVGNKTKKPANKAIVDVVFDNSGNVFQGFPGEDLTISREVNQKGKGVYRLNGKRCTRDMILMQLSLAGIDPDGFNFILQGKIVELTHMGTEDRRIFIEELVGLQKFDEERDKALKELEKADQDLVKFEAIFQEVAKQLKRVEKEKNDALRWKALDDKIKDLNARLISLNIKKLRDEEEQLLIFIDESKKKIEEIEESITTCEDDMEQESKVMETLTGEIENLEGDRNDLEMKISNLRSELSSKKTELKLLAENLEKVQDRKAKLEAKQEKLDEGMTYGELLESVQEEIEALKIQISKTRGEIQDRENQQKSFENEISIFQQELNAFNKKLNTASSSKSSLETELKLTRKNVSKLETKKASLEKELSKLLKDKDDNIEDAMAEAQSEAKAIQGEIDKIKLELKKETKKQKQFELEINQLRNEVSKHDKQLGDVKGKIKVAQSEQELWEKEIHKIKRESKNAQINKEKFEENLKELTSEIEKITKQIDSKEQLIKELKAERDEVSKMIESSQQEYENVEGEITGIMNTLEMLTENFKESLIGMKATFQEDGLDAVDESMIDIKTYVEDLMELIKSLKEISGSPEDLEQGFQSIDFFIENYEETLSGLKELIQGKINDLVQSNTEVSSSYLQDFIEIMSQVHLSLRKLSMTRNTEQINALHELDNKNRELQDEYSVQAVNKTKVEGQLKQVNIDLSNTIQRIADFEAQYEDLSQKIEERNAIISENESKIGEITSDKDKIQAVIDEKSAEKEEFWELSNRLNQDIEERNADLQVVQDRIRGLQTVQKLIRDIEEHEVEITESNQKIGVNTEKIAKLEVDIKDIEDSKAAKDKDIQDLQKKKAEVAQEEKDLRTRLEQEDKQVQGKQKRVNQLNSMIVREKEIAEISAEIDGITRSLEDGEIIIDELGDSIEEHNAKKDGVVEQIASLNSKKQSVWGKQKALQEELSKLNSSFSTNSNKLHNFENRVEEISVNIEGLYERSKEFGALPEVLEGWTETSIKEDIKASTDEKHILEPVNLKSIEQYEIVKNRFDDIDLRRQSLQRERKAILENIERIELEKTRQFMKAFNEMNMHFTTNFSKLSPGGVAKMVLENPAKPFEGGIVIEARPRGKKIKSIESLSGGEKTLVALSFIFSVEEFQPSPFYVMDEIDAALDGPNVHRVSSLIREFSDKSQFIVISHREENIVNADKIYGVSMKDAITDVFSIEMEEMEAVSEDKNMADILKDEA